MKTKKRNQAFTIFVLVMFLGSSLAFAFMYTMPESDNKVKYFYDRPLSEDEEAVFLNSNIVIIQEFFSPSCSHCKSMESVINEIMTEFEGNIVLEMVDINKYQAAAESFDVTGVPTFILKGSRIETVAGEVSKEELAGKICDLFQTPIDKCVVY